MSNLKLSYKLSLFMLAVSLMKPSHSQHLHKQRCNPASRDSGKLQTQKKRLNIGTVQYPLRMWLKRELAPLLNGTLLETGDKAKAHFTSERSLSFSECCSWQRVRRRMGSTGSFWGISCNKGAKWNCWRSWDKDEGGALNLPIYQFILQSWSLGWIKSVTAKGEKL